MCDNFLGNHDVLAYFGHKFYFIFFDVYHLFVRTVCALHLVSYIPFPFSVRLLCLDGRFCYGRTEVLHVAFDNNTNDFFLSGGMMV